MLDANKMYCQVALRAILMVNLRMLETPIAELVKSVPYGKDDTRELDAIPEIVIREALEEFDKEIVFFTEEVGREESVRLFRQINDLPIVFISDPTDRSSYLAKFLRSYEEKKPQELMGRIVGTKSASARWEQVCDRPASLTGATSAITGVKRGQPFFNITLNYVTQEIFLACRAGMRVYKIPKSFNIDAAESISVEDILEKGMPISFGHKKVLEIKKSKRFATFLGKTVYGDNFSGSGMFPETSISTENVVYKEPGGPTRILLLSELYRSRSIGFIFSNGEKITEWIHWLPWVGIEQDGHYPLRIFEVYVKQATIKDGVLMAPTPTYSIFKRKDGKGTPHVLNFAKLADHKNPAKYRETLMVSLRANHWAANQMVQSQHRELLIRT